MLSLGALVGVALGSSMGGFVRWCLKQWPGGHGGTWLANMVACALLGAVSAAHTSPMVFFIVGTGGAGALSTWSTLAAEWGALYRDHRWARLAGEAAASIVGGLAAASLGGWAAGVSLGA